MQAIKTLETNNNIYHIGIGYAKTAKTSYEEQREQREAFIRITAQRTSAIVLIVICSLISAYTGECMVLVVGSLLGLLMILCKNLFYKED